MLHPDRLDQPLRWRKPRRVFVVSMGDLFHKDVPDKFIDRVFAVMALSPQHTFQVLTKRPARMAEYVQLMIGGRRHLGDALGEIGYEGFAGRLAIVRAFGVKFGTIAEPPYRPFPNVWLGTSAENQQAADERIPTLLQTPAAVRFVSCEPLLGPVDLRPWLPFVMPPHDEIDEDPRVVGYPPESAFRDADKLRWVICGGESGPNARPMHPDWARSLRDQCQRAGVPFLFKQWGEWLPVSQATLGRPGQVASVRSCLAGDGESADVDSWYRVGKKAAGRKLDGRTWDEHPAQLREGEV
jgi:protein gp37